MRLLSYVLLVVVYVFTIGCQNKSNQLKADETIKKYLYLFENRKYDDAYLLLTENYKKQFKYDVGMGFIEYYKTDIGALETKCEEFKIEKSNGNQYLVSFIRTAADAPGEYEKLFVMYKLILTDNNYLIEKEDLVKQQIKKDGQWIDVK